MAKKHEDFFFQNFVESITVSCEAADMLREILNHFDAARLPEQLDALHEVEHRGDQKKHELVSEIVRAFITPLERDDIMALSQNIDNVTDSVEDILQRIYMTNTEAIRPDALSFATLLCDCCRSAQQLLEEFSDFRKSKKLHGLIVEINRLEEEGDKMYVQAMRQLHTTSQDALEILVWREIYGFFENACDACEDVADVVQNITIGNT